MCACENGGQCVAPELGDKLNNDSKFIVQGCTCAAGYTGRFCENDIDACTFNGNPCFTGVNCTDQPPPANITGFICGPCPSGYFGDGLECIGKSRMIMLRVMNLRMRLASAPTKRCHAILFITYVYRTIMWVISLNMKKPRVFITCFIKYNKKFYFNYHLLANSTSDSGCSKNG